MGKLDTLYIGSNTKMYKTIAQTEEFLTGLYENTKDIPRDNLEFFIIPSFTTLERARKCVSNDYILLGAQNMGWEEEGQFSGEISPIMLKEVGVDLVMIGHSERRFVIGETSEMENKRVLCALRNDLTALLCIGETASDRDYGISDEVLATQLKIGLHGVDKSQIKKIRVAYEPLWAIGVNGIPATPEYVEARHAGIKKALCDVFGEAEGMSVPTLYGGSVNLDNCADLIALENVDGLFIGRNAWEADNFNRIIRKVLPVWNAKV